MPPEKLPIHAVILAGGRGTRFWPTSRTKNPKQLLKIFGKRTMLQQTVLRLAPLVPARRVWTVTNSEQTRALKKQIPAPARARVLIEPVGRNTTAAIALAALHIRHETKSDALMAVLPADQYIAQSEKYRKIIEGALKIAREPGRLVVLGIPPGYPETGYGYVERMGEAIDANGFPAYAVRRFTEKPALETAKLYLAQGNFYWNAGMFFWRVSTFLENLERYLPSTYDAFATLAKSLGKSAYNRKLAAIYPKLENISIDYAILEKATEGKGNVFVVPAEIGWSDIGSWNAVYNLHLEAGDHGSANNVFLSDAYAIEAAGNLVSAPNKFTAVIGVNDLVVVQTDDAVLVCHRDQAQDVSKLVKHLESQKRKDLL